MGLAQALFNPERDKAKWNYQVNSALNCAKVVKIKCGLRHRMTAFGFFFPY